MKTPLLTIGAALAFAWPVYAQNLDQWHQGQSAEEMMARMEEREMFVREQLEKCPLLLNPTNPPEILVSFDHVTIYPGNYRKKWTWPKNSLDAEAKVIGLLVMICDWDRDNQNPGKVAVAECVHVTYLQYGGKIAGEAIVKRKDYATESALSDAFTAALKERGEALPHKTQQPAHHLN